METTGGELLTAGVTALRLVKGALDDEDFRFPKLDPQAFYLTLNALVNLAGEFAVDAYGSEQYALEKVTAMIAQAEAVLHADR